MPSTNWIKSTYVMEGNVLYSHSINLMLISSIKHPHRNIWNNIWPKIWIPWFSQVDTQNEPSQTSFNHTGSLAEYKLESPGRKGSSSFFSHSCHQYLCPHPPRKRNIMNIYHHESHPINGEFKCYNAIQ